jgi:hypothetical protein
MNRLMPLLLAFAAVVATAGPATAHDWYSGLKSPITGGPCCSTRDCEAVPSRYANGGLELYANGLWTPARREALLGVTAPDSQVHACWANRRSGEAPRFICIMVGGEV